VEAALSGDSAQLKEYAIGVEVLRRGEDFDPRIDPIVRVQARKLRAKLAEYYAGEGRHSRVLIQFAKGGYVPSFSPAAVVEPDAKPAANELAPKEPPAAAVSAPGPGRFWKYAFFAALAIIVAQAAIYWRFAAHGSRAATSPAAVAILDFANSSGDPTAGAIASRISERARATLDSSGTFRAAATAAPSGSDPQRVCAEVKTTALLRGFVRVNGGRVAIKGELYSSGGRTRIWTANYLTELTEGEAGWNRIGAEIARRAEEKLLEVR
jgi:TolB-like protein